MSDVLSLYKSSVKYVKDRNNYYLQNDDIATEKIEIIAKILDKYNLFLLLAEGYEKRIWNDLVQKNKSMDTFIIDETILYFKNNIDSEPSFNRLADHVAACQCILNNPKNAIGENVIKSMSVFTTTSLILKQNPWLLYLSLFNDSLSI